MWSTPGLFEQSRLATAADSLMLSGMTPDERAYSLFLAQTESRSVWLYLSIWLLAQWVAGSLYVGMRGLTAALLPRITLIAFAGVALQFLVAPLSIISFSLALMVEGLLLFIWCRRLISWVDLVAMTLVMVVAGFSLAGLAAACFLVY